MTVYRSSKTFRNFPCSHRRWRHHGHCAYIHGYSRSFVIWFGCDRQTENGFVVDFGSLGGVKDWLEEKFDHTMLLDSDDPLLDDFRRLESLGACRLVVFDDVGMEGTARYVFNWVDSWIREKTQGRAWVISVEVRENDKNSAMYCPNRGAQPV